MVLSSDPLTIRSPNMATQVTKPWWPWRNVFSNVPSVFHIFTVESHDPLTIRSPKVAKQDTQSSWPSNIFSNVPLLFHIFIVVSYDPVTIRSGPNIAIQRTVPLWAFNVLTESKAAVASVPIVEMFVASGTVLCVERFSITSETVLCVASGSLLCVASGTVLCVERFSKLWFLAMWSRLNLFIASLSVSKIFFTSLKRTRKLNVAQASFHFFVINKPVSLCAFASSSFASNCSSNKINRPFISSSSFINAFSLFEGAAITFGFFAARSYR